MTGCAAPSWNSCTADAFFEPDPRHRAESPSQPAIPTPPDATSDAQQPALAAFLRQGTRRAPPAGPAGRAPCAYGRCLLGLPPSLTCPPDLCIEGHDLSWPAAKTDGSLAAMGQPESTSTKEVSRRPPQPDPGGNRGQARDRNGPPTRAARRNSCLRSERPRVPPKPRQAPPEPGVPLTEKLDLRLNRHLNTAPPACSNLFVPLNAAS